MTKSVKRHLTRFFSVIFSISLLSTYGCQKGQIDPNDYPIPIQDETKINDTVTEPVVTDTSSLFKDALVPEPNSLKENGKYTFNAAVIPDAYLKQYKEKPQVIMIAKELLRAIDNVDEEFELDYDEEDGVSSEDIDNAFMVAYFSNPMMSVVDYVPLDDNTYQFKYFPAYYFTEGSSLIENGSISFESRDEMTTDEASKYLEDFKSYVTDVINKNCTADDTQIQMAEKIYKALIEDFEVEFPDYEGFLDPSTLKEDEAAYMAGEVVRSVYDRKFTSAQQFTAFYSFILQQLHIEVLEISGYSGVFSQEAKEIVPKDNVEYMYWNWHILCLDGQYYHCDIVLEKLAYDKRYEGVSGAEADTTYFGMSDKKRCESYKFSKSSLFVGNDPSFTGMNGSGGYDVPECTEDYDF